ncbi:MAG: hypothetical protein WDN26_21555 [Chitinophagaceae bacterium]
MESNFRNSDFEEYVKQNADQHRMFPSEKVWKNVHNALHTKRKWYGMGLAALLLLTGTAVTLVMISYPVSKKQEVATIKNSPAATIVPATSKEEINKNILPFNGQLVEPSGNNPLFAERSSSAVDRSAVAQQNTEETNEVAPVPLVEQTHLVNHDRERNAVTNEVRSNAIISKTDTKEFFSVIDNNDPVEEKSPVVAEKKITSENIADYPLTIESITNAYHPKKAGKRTSWQFFITPTVSYRKLNTKESFNSSAASNYPYTNLSNVNSAVTHKADLGLQIGTSFHHPLTKSLRIRGGLQFNINRYDIKAYSYNPEVATIRLNDANGASAVWAWTYYRNNSGYKSDWLKNYYFSVSVPIGLEMKIIGNKKTSFGIASTIQPTYILKDKAYLISTDYKNYAKVPSLVRHLNANAGFEAFVNYSNGKTRWQVGPQARYQLFSSFQNKYPVKEHLFDFGLKLGVFLNEK